MMVGEALVYLGLRMKGGRHFKKRPSSIVRRSSRFEEDARFGVVRWCSASGRRARLCVDVVRRKKRKIAELQRSGLTSFGGRGREKRTGVRLTEVSMSFL
ncbi:hypothetical protein KSP40_PGU010513 [Platanthera guangdongensis]|uniref:Ribosomal protein S14 n=1 Tax=Platanthera guangdongensis TaxID=2320717 RepID=A0ABR2MDR8_9ASPA